MRYRSFRIAYQSRFRSRPCLSGFSAITAVALVTVSVLAGSVSAQQGPIRLNRAIEKLEKGEAILGLISTDRSLTNARALASSDLDFVIIDMEHGALDLEQLHTFLLGMTDKAAILRKGNLQPSVTPLVRITPYGRENLQFIVKQALDLGVFGIMFPTINTKAEALNAVRAARYPQPKGAQDMEPAGQRGSGPTNAIWYWGIPSAEYTQRADTWPLDRQGELLLFLQAESAEAVKNIDEILEVPGIGAIFIGPSDLSLSLGVGGVPNAPELEAAIQTVLKACLARNVPCAITTSVGDVARRLREGFRIVTVGGDGGMTPGTDATLKAGRAALRR